MAANSPRGAGEAARILRSTKWPTDPAQSPEPLRPLLRFVGLREEEEKTWAQVSPEIHRIGVGYLAALGFQEIAILRKDLAAATDSAGKAAAALEKAAADVQALHGLAADYALGYLPDGAVYPTVSRRGGRPDLQGEGHAALVQELFGPLMAAYAKLHAAWEGLNSIDEKGEEELSAALNASFATERCRHEDSDGRGEDCPRCGPIRREFEHVWQAGMFPPEAWKTEPQLSLLLAAEARRCHALAELMRLSAGNFNADWLPQAHSTGAGALRSGSAPRYATKSFVELIGKYFGVDGLRRIAGGTEGFWALLRAFHTYATEEKAAVKRGVDSERKGLRELVTGELARRGVKAEDMPKFAGRGRQPAR